MRPAMVNIGEEALLHIDEGFEREQDPYGVAWTPLSLETVSWKRENSRILKILQSTGRLRASITYQADESRVIIGTNVSYAKKHQLGIGVRKREFLGIGPRLQLAIVGILEDYLLDLEE